MKISNSATAIAAFLLFTGGCKKSEPPKTPSPAKSTAVKKAPAPTAQKPAPKPPEPKKVAAKKPAPKKPEPVKASRKASAEDKTVMKDILDINVPEITASKLPVIVLFDFIWVPTHRMTVGLLEEIAAKYEGRVKFYIVDAAAATAKKVLPKDIPAYPYLLFIKDGKRFGKVGFTGDPKELSFALEDWLAGGDEEDEDDDEEDDAEEL